MNQNSLAQSISTTINVQREANKNIRSVKYRKTLIKKVMGWMVDNEPEIRKAIQSDFKKPDLEIDLTEIWFCVKEARYILRNLSKWMRKQRVSKTIPLISTKSYLERQPKGIVLVIAPWNYPFQLTIMPLLSALAAGNSVILKPSEKTPHVSDLILKMVSQLFKPRDVAVFEGGEKTVSELLNNKFDHILYTGGTAVGQIIMEKAAKTLTPVTLELGGKCPAVIDSSANIKEAAKKIAYFKFINVGQTCVAPDYVLVDEKIKDSFVESITEYVYSMYGDINLIDNNKDYGRIVNQDHLKRLRSILDETLSSGDSLSLGGKYNEEDCFMSPTIIDSGFSSPVMREEIFGPILPIIAYSDFNNAISRVNSIDSPLAMYVFSKSKANINQFINCTQSGGVGVNDVSLHLVHSKLPFGGVGKSGIGRYQGKFGFEEFSHLRPVIKNIDSSPLKMLHPPYGTRVKKIVNILKKWL
jgi:aldehyde dehydrogenase (NAD+)